MRWLKNIFSYFLPFFCFVVFVFLFLSFYFVILWLDHRTQVIFHFYNNVCFALHIHLGSGVKPQNDKMNNLLDCHATARNDNVFNFFFLVPFFLFLLCATHYLFTWFLGGHHPQKFHFCGARTSPRMTKLIKK